MIAIPKVITPKNTVCTLIDYAPTVLKSVYPSGKKLALPPHNARSAIVEQHTADLEISAYPKDSSPPRKFNYHPRR